MYIINSVQGRQLGRMIDVLVLLPGLGGQNGVLMFVIRAKTVLGSQTPKYCWRAPRQAVYQTETL